MPELTFTTLKSDHDQLDELFLLHQESLLDQDLPQALEGFDRYERELREHIRFEEEELMPIYRRAGRIPGGPEEFFTGEHLKILEMLGRCRAQLVELLTSSIGDRHGIIRLFDLESALKSLIDHHHSREESLFFPALDRVATEDERWRILAMAVDDRV